MVANSSPVVAPLSPSATELDANVMEQEHDYSASTSREAEAALTRVVRLKRRKLDSGNVVVTTANTAVSGKMSPASTTSNGNSAGGRITFSRNSNGGVEFVESAEAVVDDELAYSPRKRSNRVSYSGFSSPQPAFFGYGRGSACGGVDLHSPDRRLASVQYPNNILYQQRQEHPCLYPQVRVHRRPPNISSHWLPNRFDDSDVDESARKAAGMGVVVANKTRVTPTPVQTQFENPGARGRRKLINRPQVCSVAELTRGSAPVPPGYFTTWSQQQQVKCNRGRGAKANPNNVKRNGVVAAPPLQSTTANPNLLNGHASSQLSRCFTQTRNFSSADGSPRRGQPSTGSRKSNSSAASLSPLAADGEDDNRSLPTVSASPVSQKSFPFSELVPAASCSAPELVDSRPPVVVCTNSNDSTTALAVRPPTTTVSARKAPNPLAERTLRLKGLTSKTFQKCWGLALEMESYNERLDLAVLAAEAKPMFGRAAPIKVSPDSLDKEKRKQNLQTDGRGVYGRAVEVYCCGTALSRHDMETIRCLPPDEQVTLLNRLNAKDRFAEGSFARSGRNAMLRRLEGQSASIPPDPKLISSLRRVCDEKVAFMADLVKISGYDSEATELSSDEDDERELRCGAALTERTSKLAKRGALNHAKRALVETVMNNERIKIRNLNDVIDRSGSKPAHFETKAAEDSSSRTRALKLPFEKRKLLNTGGIHSWNSASAVQPTVWCGCAPPQMPCVSCSGRVDAVRHVPVTLAGTDPLSRPLHERASVLEPTFDSRLSSPNSIYFLRIWEAYEKELASGAPRPKRKGVAKRSSLKLAVAREKKRLKFHDGKVEKKKHKLTLRIAASLKKKSKGPKRRLDLAPKSAPPVGSAAKKSGKLADKRRCFRSVSSYDFDNIVIDHSAYPSTTRPEKIKYKEIPTPSWSVVERSSNAAESIEMQSAEFDDKTLRSLHAPNEAQEHVRFLQFKRQVYVMGKRPSELESAAGPAAAVTKLESLESNPTPVHVGLQTPVEKSWEERQACYNLQSPYSLRRFPVPEYLDF